MTKEKAQHAADLLYDLADAIAKRTISYATSNMAGNELHNEKIAQDVKAQLIEALINL